MEALLKRFRQAQVINIQAKEVTIFLIFNVYFFT